jgi:hypothetical protein
LLPRPLQICNISLQIALSRTCGAGFYLLLTLAAANFIANLQFDSAFRYAAAGFATPDTRYADTKKDPLQKLQ